MIKSAEFTTFSTFSLTKGSWRVTIVPKYLYLVQGGNIMSGNICVPQIGEFSEKKFEKILKQTYYDALVKEIENLREWYFYEDKHSQFNEEFYIFKGKLCDGKLSIDDRLNLAIGMFSKAYQYMCLFYSSSPKLDVDLLTEPWGEDLEIERQENNAKEKKRGRPKGSKNKKGKGKKKSVNRKQTKSAKNRNKTA